MFAESVPGQLAWLPLPGPSTAHRVEPLNAFFAASTPPGRSVPGSAIRYLLWIFHRRWTASGLQATRPRASHRQKVGHHDGIGQWPGLFVQLCLCWAKARGVIVCLLDAIPRREPLAVDTATVVCFEDPPVMTGRGEQLLAVKTCVLLSLDDCRGWGAGRENDDGLWGPYHRTGGGLGDGRNRNCWIEGITA